VASRYATQPTYSEVLAATMAEQAERQQAMDVAAQREAHAAQEEMRAAERAAELAALASSGEAAGTANHATEAAAQSPSTPGTPVMPKFAERSREMRLHQTPRVAEPSLEELLASSVVEPRALLPSKLIEFPRELVSAHKSRPRIPDPPPVEVPAEVLDLEPSQLRIFEVEPEQENVSSIAGTVASAAEPKLREEAVSAPTESASAAAAMTARVTERTALPHVSASQTAAATPASAAGRDAQMSGVRTFKGLEWAAISLDKEPETHGRKKVANIADSTPFLADSASIDRRVMAFAVDFALVSAAFLGFLAVFVAATPRLPTGLTAMALAGTVYVALWVLYQMLFFSLSGATAGMLYARIALCTFDDRNPNRSALRRRLAAWWLSCLPLGLGFFWSFMDEDNLSWHDRMTGMYQRTY
jgi:uncharacterized RDD family membrane protein YckC